MKEQQYEPRWRVTRRLTLDDFACDHCAASPVDTVHFLPWVVDCERVVFACPAHDAGGYDAHLQELLEEDKHRARGRYSIGQNIAKTKHEGWKSLAMFDERVREREHEIAESERNPS